MTKKIHDDDLKNVSGGGSLPQSEFAPREPDPQVPLSKPGGGSGGGVGNTGIDAEGGGGGMQELS